ncbi:30S ribosomal protein S8 [Thermomicrobiaceae bacterium CFH 74404]|uniref:Small ribosomal subunit protein uS8 n=1 Tax=Thermalbibacter longus TaxID=2951981 RepID=A0AA41WHI7_9BACT|nr:30S ribosomal protein S8 [Thermalbibacter longus]MCM8750565.1 30S ribosomal protein S8 [Thermalbibacter longus]
MTITDPIGDMVTRIRNAGMGRKQETSMRASRILIEIARILKEEGYIEDYSVEPAEPRPILKIRLKYTPDRRHAIREIKRVSKPGLRIYAGKDRLPRVKNGLGIAIVSTSQGVMSDVEARRRGIGGEVLCTVF